MPSSVVSCSIGTEIRTKNDNFDLGNKLKMNLSQISLDLQFEDCYVPFYLQGTSTPPQVRHRDPKKSYLVSINTSQR